MIKKRQTSSTGSLSTGILPAISRLPFKLFESLSRETIEFLVIALAVWTGLVRLSGNSLIEKSSFLLLIPVALVLSGLLLILRSHFRSNSGDLREAIAVLRPAGLLLLLLPFQRVPAHLDLLLWLLVISLVYRVFSTKAETLSGSKLFYVFTVLPFAFLLLTQMQVTQIHDAFQYSAVAHSLFFNRDLRLFDQIYIQNPFGYYNPYAHGSLRYMGVPLLHIVSIPFGELLRLALNSFWLFLPQTVGSLPYLVTYGVLNVALTLGGLALLFRLLSRSFSPLVAVLAPLAALLLSPNLYFTFHYPGWTHSPSFFLLSALVYFLFNEGLKNPLLESRTQWLTVGAILGFATIVRPTNLLFAVFPLCRALENGVTKNFRTRALSLIPFTFIVGLQPLAWYLVSGDALGGPYKEIGDHFSFLEPDFLGILFSAREHGLAVWSPLFFLLLIFSLTRTLELRNFFLPASIVILLHTWVYASWSVWWTGVGFSNRFFCPLLPVVAVALAILLDRARSPIKTRLLFGVILAGVFINLVLIGAYRSSKIPYGIPGPERIEVLDYSAKDLYGDAFDESRSSSELLLAHGHNVPFFPSVVHDALDLHRVPTYLALAIFTLSLLGLWGVFSVFWTASHHPLFWLFFTLPLAALGYVLLLTASPPPKGDSHRFCRAPVNHFFLSPYTYHSWLKTDCPSTASELTLLSTAFRIPDYTFGKQVGLLRVQNNFGEEFEFPIRLGIETDSSIKTLGGDTHRNEGRQLNRRLVRAPTYAYLSSKLSLNSVFKHQYTLPFPMVIERVQFEFYGRVGGVQVHDVFLR